MFIKVIPILPVYEMLPAISFYESKLGFKAMNMGIWGVVKREQIELHLQLISNKQSKYTISCSIYTNNIEDQYAEFCSKELITPAGRLQKNHLGIIEFFILDNTGNKLYFRGT